jgi:predicted Rossmann-fold nucleotide-binding protein
LVLVGSHYWDELLDFMRRRMVPEGTISPEDVDRFLVTDSPKEAVSYIHSTVTERFGLAWKPKPTWVLREKSPGRSGEPPKSTFFGS